MIRTLVLLLACVVLPTTAVAQADDAAYCAQLGDLARRYTASAGGESRPMPDTTTLAAIADCNKGNTAAGIPVLEKKLRDSGFTLPKR
jgi:hypothetical protein